LRGEVNRSKSPEMAGLLKALGKTIGLFQSNAKEFVQGVFTYNPSGGILVGGKAEVLFQPGLDVQALIDERNTAKKSKDFALADTIRKQLDKAGIVLEDKPGGVTEWRRK